MFKAYCEVLRNCKTASLCKGKNLIQMQPVRFPLWKTITILLEVSVNILGKFYTKHKVTSLKKMLSILLKWSQINGKTHLKPSPGFPYPTVVHPGALSTIISCFFSTCVSPDNSFPSVRQEPSFGPWKGSAFLQQNRC